jgi:hypothetical protein
MYVIVPLPFIYDPLDPAMSDHCTRTLSQYTYLFFCTEKISNPFRFGDAVTVSVSTTMGGISPLFAPYLGPMDIYAAVSVTALRPTDI